MLRLRASPSRALAVILFELLICCATPSWVRVDFSPLNSCSYIRCLTLFSSFSFSLAGSLSSGYIAATAFGLFPRNVSVYPSDSANITHACFETQENVKKLEEIISHKFKFKSCKFSCSLYDWIIFLNSFSEFVSSLKKAKISIVNKFWIIHDPISSCRLSFLLYFLFFSVSKIRPSNHIYTIFPSCLRC